MPKKVSSPKAPDIKKRSPRGFKSFDHDDAVKARSRAAVIIDHVPPDVLVASIKATPSLRGMMSGYVAEVMFADHVPKTYDVILSAHIESHDDHDRALNKSDRTIHYGNRKYRIQVKSMRTGSICFNKTTEVLQADVQNDGSDKREISLTTGEKVSTTCYKRGDYDILAVPLFPFTGDASFAYKRNRDCRQSQHTKYIAAGITDLLASTEQITWPLDPGWSTDLLSLLDGTIGLPFTTPEVIADASGKAAKITPRGAKRKS